MYWAVTKPTVTGILAVGGRGGVNAWDGDGGGWQGAMSWGMVVVVGGDTGGEETGGYIYIYIYVCLYII